MPPPNSTDATDAQIVAGKLCPERHTNAEIGEAVGLSEHTARARYYRVRRQKLTVPQVPCPVCGHEPEEGDDTRDWRREYSFEVEGNYAVASSTDGRVRSEEDLYAAIHVDLAIWKSIYFKAGTWEGWAKDEHKDIRWENGGIQEGYVRADGVIIETLFRTEARFVRREPVPLMPAIQPVLCEALYPFPAPPTKNGVRRSLIGADPQVGYRRHLRTGELVPFHDRAAMDLFLQIAEYEQPEHIDVLGDGLDFPMWSDKFSRSPEFYFTTQPSILEFHWWLRRLRESCPDADICLFEGNHDARMRLALQNHLHEACELRPADELELPPAMSPERLLALHQLGVRWIGEYPDGADYRGPVRLEHGDTARKPPGATASAVVKDTDEHTAYGHAHRIEMVSRRIATKRARRTVTALCPGCLCRTDGMVPGSKSDDNWQKGLLKLEFTETEFNPAFAEIHGDSVIWDGKVFTARDSWTEDLRRAYPGWNW